jgi:hypothetical protein
MVLSKSKKSKKGGSSCGCTSKTSIKGGKRRTKSKVSKKGGSSDYLNTHNSRGPINTPDIGWSNGKANFRQFNKTGEYIPNSKLVDATIPIFAGVAKDLTVPPNGSGFDPQASTLGSLKGGAKKKTKSTKSKKAKKSVKKSVKKSTKAKKAKKAKKSVKKTTKPKRKTKKSVKKTTKPKRKTKKSVKKTVKKVTRKTKKSTKPKRKTTKKKTLMSKVRKLFSLKK